MSLVATEPQPALAWTFNGTTTDYVSGLAPSSTFGSSSYVAGKYGQAIKFNNPGGTSANYISYALSGSYSPTSFTFAYWVNLGEIPVLNVQVPVYLTDSLASSTQLRIPLSPTVSSGSNPYIYNGTSILIGPNVSQGVWYHFCMVLKPGAGGSTAELYVNGVSYGTTLLTNNQAAVINNMYVGSANATFGAICSIDDLRIFNTSLTDAQVLSVYKQQGMPGRAELTLPMPRPGLEWQFESSNVESVTGLAPSFSTINGSLTTLPSYVSGNYGQAINFLNPVTGYAANGTPSNACVQYTTTSLGYSMNSFTISYWLNPSYAAFPLPSTGGQPSPLTLGLAGFNLQNQINSSSGLIYWFVTATMSSLAAIPLSKWSNHVLVSSNIDVNATTSNTIMSYYINSVFQASANLAVSGNSLNLLTLGGRTDKAIGFAGLVDDVRVYNAILTPSQINAIYNSSGMPSRQVLVGAPLFSQLSAAAASSAVGAFSLRAVNGVTARAVQIRRSSDSVTLDFYADSLGNLLTQPVVGQTLANWLAGSIGYVTTWYDQTGKGNDMNQPTTANQPVLTTTTTPASLIFTGTEYFQNTVPFTFNFGSGAFTLRYVVSNNTGGIVLYKADSADFVWSYAEKKFWLGDGTIIETSQGGYPSQVGNSEDYVLGAAAIGSSKTSVVHRGRSITNVPIYVNGTIQSLSRNSINMKTDPGNYLYFGKAGSASNYIGNMYEIEIFSTALSDADRLVLEN